MSNSMKSTLKGIEPSFTGVVELNTYVKPEKGSPELKTCKLTLGFPELLYRELEYYATVKKKVSRNDLLENSLKDIINVITYFNSCGLETQWGKYSDSQYFIDERLAGMIYPKKLTLFGSLQETNFIQPWAVNLDNIQIVSPHAFELAQSNFFNMMKMDEQQNLRSISELRDEAVLTAELIKRCCLQFNCLDYVASNGLPITINHNFYNIGYVNREVVLYIEEYLRSKLR